MKNEIITNVLDQMSPYLNNTQIQYLQASLQMTMHNCTISHQESNSATYDCDNFSYLQKFLLAKGASGLSQHTLKNYFLTISMFLDSINKPLTNVEYDDLVYYLETYRQERNVSFSRIRNMQSALSSFFTWLSKKRYIYYNPVSQLDSVKVPQTIKKPLSDEERIMLQIKCNELRDIAIMEFLYSTGVRISELVALNREDVNFITNEVIVMGKGSKERIVYLTPSAKIYLNMYLKSRTDNNKALFVSLRKPHKRIAKNGIEVMLRKLGEKCGIKNVHPHKFRRTMATNALDRGMPLEQVSKMLGHTKLDTTQIYCTINQENIKISHRKYLAS